LLNLDLRLLTSTTVGGYISVVLRPQSPCFVVQPRTLQQGPAGGWGDDADEIPGHVASCTCRADTLQRRRNRVWGTEMEGEWPMLGSEPPFFPGRAPGSNQSLSLVGLRLLPPGELLPVAGAPEQVEAPWACPPYLWFLPLALDSLHLLCRPDLKLAL
jgi:hypothetical protein